MVENNYRLILENKLINDQFGIISIENNTNTIVQPGQFINIYLNNADKMMPRPFSIFSADDNSVKVVYKIVGTGTEIISTLKAGEKIRAMFPLGNSFPLPAQQNIALVGGGVGIPPLVNYLKTNKNNYNIDFYYGSRGSKELILLDEINQITENLYISTDDGSQGIKGNVITALKKNDKKYDVILACGPHPMLKALNGYSDENGIKLYVSLEERMGCGFGVCMGCVVKVKKDNSNEEPYSRVCKEGPVFDSEIIDWE